MWRENRKGGNSTSHAFAHWNHRNRSHFGFKEEPSSPEHISKYYSYIVASERLSIPLAMSSVGGCQQCVELTANQWIARPNTPRSRVTKFGYKNTLKVTVTASLQGIELSSSKFRPSCTVYFTKKQFIYDPMTTKYVKVIDLKVGDHVCSKMVNLWRVTAIEDGGYREVVELCILDRQKYMIGLPQLSVVSFSPYRDHEPIHSYGIIAYRLNDESVREYLLVQRRDTMAYRDLIRGKYCNRPIVEICRIYFEEMTQRERHQIQSWPFDQLWKSIWTYGVANEEEDELNMDFPNQFTVQQYILAEQKFKALDIAYLSNLVGSSQYTEPECGFPKGRPIRHESNLETAMREFTEEVNLDATDQKNLIILSKEYLEERFVATNGLSYIHTYYLAKLTHPHFCPHVDPSNLQQQCEVGMLFFATLDGALNKFRSYDRAKKQTLIQADLVLQDLDKESEYGH